MYTAVYHRLFCAHKQIKSAASCETELRENAVHLFLCIARQKENMVLLKPCVEREGGVSEKRSAQLKKGYLHKAFIT